MRHADVVIREDGPVEGLVRSERNVLDLGEAVDQVGDVVAEADRRRVERNVEPEAAGTGEGGGIAARDAVLFEDDDLKALPGECRSRAEAAQTRADDDRVVGPWPGEFLKSSAFPKRSATWLDLPFLPVPM
jgi:hypothetical protein